VDYSHYIGYPEAIKRICEHQSARMRHLMALESYVDGTQYAGRADWFSAECPLWERAPCVVYPIAKSAIDSNVDLVLGAQTFPTICVPVTDDQLEDGLEQDEAETLNHWLYELVEHARLRPVSRELFGAAQGCGSACAIVGIRKGRLVVDTVKAAWCMPALDADGAVVSLVIEYPYLQQSKQPDGKWRVDAMLYRRVIDAIQDITYAPAKLDGTEPSWKTAKASAHGLGFCPVVWYPHLRGCTTVAECDGKAVHCNLLDEITALDFTLSQRHRAALYAGDPQWTEIGVEPGYNPSGGGRFAQSMPASVAGGAPSATNQVTTSYQYPGLAGKVRKKSPGDVWQYENPDTKVTLHTLPGDALTSLDSHAKDLKSKICEALGVVFMDPENVPRGGELSSRTVAEIRARQLDRCDSYRSDFGDLCLRPLVTMLLRVSVAKPGIQLPGLAKVLKLIETVLDRGLLLRLNWGPYMRPEPQEVLALVQAAVAAVAGGIATTRSAVLMTKDVLCVEDIDEHVEQLEEHAKQQMQKTVDQAAALAETAKKPEGKDDPKPKPEKAA
jgi:hypothetical protein